MYLRKCLYLLPVDAELSVMSSGGSSGGSSGRPEAERLVNRLRNTNPSKFRTMCMMHLSFLLDLPGASLEEFLEDSAAAHAAHKRNFHFAWKRNSKEKLPESGIFGAALTFDIIEQVLPLIEFLGRPENISQEGLFRKNGHVARQRVLREKMNTGANVKNELDTGAYTTHDVAGVLKIFLGELPEPLLTERHYLAHVQVLDMVREGMADDLRIMNVSKQLQTIQLLLQLLPQENSSLLQHLLDLLHRVANDDGNKMTHHTLGTLIAPHILAPKKMSPAELQSVACNITRAVALMIENAPALFKPPPPLVRDIANYWEEMEEATDSRPSSAKSDDETEQCRQRYRKRAMPSDVINTTLTFVDRKASLEHAAQTDTQTALAQLYAHVSNMPESAKKRRLMKQFNKANGGVGTPGHSPGNSKHKRSRSLGDSLKKMVSRSNHKRRGSGHSIQAHILSAGHTPGHADSPIMSQHTPVIKRLQQQDPSTPVATTPVMRLFKNEHTQAVLPDSPRVEIVDMKAGFKTPFPRRRGTLGDENCSPLIAMIPASPCSARSSSKVCPTRLSLLGEENQEPSFRAHPQLLPKKCALSPVLVTAESRFDKPTAFISPISHSVNKAPKSVQTNIMTPGSRKPMAIIQSPE